MTVFTIIATALGLAGAMVLFIYYLVRRDEATVARCALALKRSSRWRLVRMGESNVFYDIDRAAANPEVAKKLAACYEESLEELSSEIGRVDKLAFIEKKLGPVGALSLKDQLVQRTSIHAVIVRPRRRLEAARIKGSLRPGSVVILVSDVATSGGTMLEAVEIFQAHGADVKGAVVFLVRDEAAKRAFSDRGVQLKWIADKELLESLTQRPSEKEFTATPTSSLIGKM